MRRGSKLWVLFIFVFVLASYVYYIYDFKLENHSLFLSLSTFLFAIFSGFFISRQSRRYSQLRDEIARFDGSSSTLYRSSGVFGDKIQNAVKKILTKHYNPILKSGEWDYPLTHKTSTIIDLMHLFDESFKNKKLHSVKSSTMSSLFRSFTYMQMSRKKMDILHQERIPVLQWALLSFLSGILLISVGAISSVGMIVPAILKGAFSTCIVLVLVILYQFNNLTFFENTIGEHSAKDVLDIMAGKR
jgi:hypothetical protein